jgi:hypothetical protein
MNIELTDSTNRAQGFALMPVIWSTGSTIGLVTSKIAPCVLQLILFCDSPLIGGIFSKPHDRWPDVFTGRFWTDYPYFLPCGIAAAFSALTFTITALFLKEVSSMYHTKLARLNDLKIALIEQTVPKKPSRAADPESIPLPSQRPLPMRELFTYPVLLSVSCYGIIALIDSAYRAILPLFYATPVHLGGLGLTPARIGTTLACFGISNGIFQAFFFARLINAIGPRRLFIIGLAMFVGLFWMFPIINRIAQETGVTAVVWCLMAMQLSMSVACDLAYGGSFLLLVFLPLPPIYTLTRLVYLQQARYSFTLLLPLRTSSRLAQRMASPSSLPLSCAL